MSVLASIILFSFILPIQPSNCDCKQVTQESPATGTVFATMNGGKVRKIQGVVFYPNAGKVMKDAIVEVYDNRTKAKDESITTAQVNQITTRKRRAACMTGEDGKFCFSGLPPGKYLLIIGHRNDSQFSAMHVVVTLDPRSKRNSSGELKVELVMSI